MSIQAEVLLAASLGLTFFLFLITLLFIIVFRKQQKKYQTLKEEKLTAELNVSKREREEIVTELHNDLIPNIIAVKMILNQHNVEQFRFVNESIKILDDTIVKSREMISNLSPISIYGIGFQKAIVDYIDSMKSHNELKINFIEPNEVHCGNEQNNYIFRIIQEIIINTIKHAQAKVLDIEISMKDNYLMIRTCDDGIGFDYSIQSQSTKKGYGLLDMQGKVEFLKGFMSFNDENKKGTQINIKIPLILGDYLINKQIL